MNPKVAERISEIKHDKVHGAGWLSIQAMGTMSLAIKESQPKDIADFIGEMNAVATELIKTKPSMVSVANYINLFMHEFKEKAKKEDGLKSLQKWAYAKSSELIELSDRATARAIEYGSGIISVADTVITCSYSSTVCNSLKFAKDNEEKFRVIVAESRVNGQSYGEITAHELKQHSIPTEVISDNSITQLVAKADKALVGADSILADGSLINGIPTLALAQASKKANIPFYAVCETAKFDVHTKITKAASLDPGLEKVSADLVTGIITEKGILAPSMVKAYVTEMARNLR